MWVIELRNKALAIRQNEANVRILIHHDERLFGEALSCMLIRRGHQVVGFSALIDDLFDLASRVSVDACLIEERPPALSGVLSELRRVAPNLPVIVLSSDLRPSTLSGAVSAGADGVCLKIDSVAEIERVMTDASSRHHAMDRGAPVWSHSAIALAKRKVATRNGASTSKSVELTPKERAVLELLVQGATTAKVASTLHIGEATVRTHLQHLFNKFGVHSRLALVASALRRQVLQLDELGRVAVPHDVANTG